MSTQVQSGPRVPPVASALLAVLAERWWLLLLRGLAAIAFGVIARPQEGLTRRRRLTSRDDPFNTDVVKQKHFGEYLTV